MYSCTLKTFVWNLNVGYLTFGVFTAFVIMLKYFFLQFSVINWRCGHIPVEAIMEALTK